MLCGACQKQVSPAIPKGICPATKGAPMLFNWVSAKKEGSRIMKCEVRNVRDVTLFRLHGDIDFTHLSDIRETIKGEIIRSSTQKFLIDLSGVGKIDSAGVGFIVSVYKTVLSRKGTFALVHPNNALNNVFISVGLNRLFKIYEHENEAITAV